MPIGPRLGADLLRTIVIGSRGAASTPLAGVTQDATSLKYWPSSGAEWTTAATAYGSAAPSKSWNCQDVAGALAAAVGAVTLASEGSRQAYNQSIAGWSRKGLQSAGDGWFSTDASFPNIATESQLILTYAKQVISGGFAIDMLWGGNFSARGIVTASAFLQARNDTTTGLAGTANVTGAVRPFWLQINRTSGVITFGNDQEYVTVAIGAVTGEGLYAVGGVAGDETSFLGIAEWEGAAAEKSPAQIKTMLQTLNWTIPWS
jgi:hypothetical protein